MKYNSNIQHLIPIAKESADNKYNNNNNNNTDVSDTLPADTTTNALADTPTTGDRSPTWRSHLNEAPGITRRLSPYSLLIRI